MSDPVNITDFPFIPLYIARLQKSRAWLRCKRRPELAFYLLNLWMRAWHEIPAGSIENDDDILCDAAMCSAEKWSELRSDILSGWVLKPDGRLYNATVSELAAEAWQSKLAQRDRTEKARQARAAARLSQTPQSSVTDNVTEHVNGYTSSVTSSKREGQGQGQGQGEERKKETASAVSKEARGSRIPDDWSLTPDLMATALAVPGSTREMAEWEAAKFRDYWRGRAGANGRHVDWVATWRNWIRGAVERSANGRGKPQQTTLDEIYGRVI